MLFNKSILFIASAMLLAVSANPAGGNGGSGGLIHRPAIRHPAIRHPSGSGLRPRPTRAASNGRTKRDNQARSSPYPTPGPMAKRADIAGTNPAGGNCANLTCRNATRRPKPKRDVIPLYPTPFLSDALD